MTLSATAPSRFVLLLSLLGAVSAQAADDPATASCAPLDRPRIGLVLGGGGARGAAHIGVLRELERLQVPVDAVAGISMGAIIGGLYAAGHSPDDLERIVGSLDWRDAFSDDERREHKRYRRKQDDREYPVDFELGLKGTELKLPRGAISGQKVALILRSLTLGVPVPYDFDKLPIPFRAVASDLVTGEQYDMASGDLARAIRASMAAPGIVAPVSYDGRTLVDGGLGGNVPVDAIRSMCADVIIAVDVEFPLYEPEQLESALDVSYQMLTILIRNQTQAQLDTLGADDLLIRPQLGQFGSTDFAHITEAIEPGRVAAAESGAWLRQHALDDAAWERHLAERNARALPVPERIDFVRVESGDKLLPQVLRAQVQTARGDRVDAESLAADASALFGLQTFDRVGYRLVREGGRDGVEFTGVDRSSGLTAIQFGMALQDDLEGETSFSVSGRLTRFAVNRLGAEWRNDLRLGTQPLIRTEFYQPLSFDSLYFVAPRIGARQTNFNIFDGDRKLARYRVSRSEFGLDLGRQLGRWGELRVGAFRGDVDTSLKVGDPALPSIEANTGGILGRLSIDTLDNGQIPTAGLLGSIEWRRSSESFGADDAAENVEAEISYVRSFGRHTLELGALMNVAVDDSDLVQNYYPLGGLLRLSGLARGEVAGPHAGLARAVYYRRSGQTGGSLFEIPLYLGASIEAGNAWQSRSDIGDSMILNGSLFLALDTYFGPLYLAAGLAEGGRSNFYLSVGLPPDILD